MVSNMIQLKSELAGAKTIGISGHVRPDGDCVGAVMATYLYIKKIMPEAAVEVMLEEPADIFSCIKDIDQVNTTFEKTVGNADEPFDVFIALDCESSRLGQAEDFFAKAGKKINIDHHISNANGCGDVNYVVPTASSASELVYDVLDDSELDVDIAQAIYIGMMHDTGVFQYSNTSPKTLQTVAKLIGYGFDFTSLIDTTFYEKSYVQNQILGRALMESIIFMDGQCIVSSLDKKTMDFYGATPKDLDGIVSQLRLTKGVECAIFMYEIGTLEYKVSMRSCTKVDVAAVAKFFGGGGHVRAAGCTMQGTFYDVVNNLSAHIEKQLKAD